ncbi:50S ribosomal protein L7/L12 [Pseudomonas aeruginosa P47]|nr:50S ribosomal protein L7/L12 [Pseudomonas aeruginosa B136-33]ENH89425.1 50S ribosomal protein L7/L12 [Pseudomonas aeruginosa PA45]OPF27113.1 50S ribosomal protein L7/L12 [Pseudomonas aeruginosa P47]OPF27369.1 50S ribosomal protein L7/L12 [Pseudomonas aeruginosa SD9]OPF27535.1 50S ribosomal protein L7/L12 [Pseudomonas aeruginosa P37]CEI75147.1 50S ribosomal protein L7/L12 [Pseudomonas aeruginosa]
MAASASSFEAPSFTTPGAPSTTALASFRPRPVSSRTTLITFTFLSPASARTMVNSVCSSAAAAAGPAAATVAAAAVTPNFSSIALISSTTCMTDISDTALMMSSLVRAMTLIPVLGDGLRPSY